MAAQKGKDLLLKADSTGTRVFSTIAGLRSRAHRIQCRDRRHHASGKRGAVARTARGGRREVGAR